MANITYSLEKIKIDLLHSIASLTEFERTFEAKAAWARQNGKTGFFINNTEFECTAEYYASIQTILSTRVQMLIDCIRHLEAHKSILEAHLEEEMRGKFNIPTLKSA